MNHEIRGYRVRDDLKQGIGIVLMIFLAILACIVIGAVLMLISSPFPHQPIQQVGTVMLPGHLIGSH